MKFLIAFVCIFLFCCNNHTEKKTYSKKLLIKSNFNLISKSKRVNTEPKNKEQQLFPIIIKYDLYSLPNIKISHPFNSFQALYKLFPGTYYQTDFEDISVSWWKAPNTKRKKFLDWASPINPSEFPQNFPWAENQTEHLSTLKYVNSKGEDCILFCTQTTEFGYGIVHCGRTTGAILGMALFMKEGNNWILKKFNPAVGCYGSFSQAPEPKISITDKGEEVFHINSSNGAAGGPSIGNDFIIFPTDTSFIQIHVIKNASRSWVFTDWYTNLEFVSDSSIFPTIIATKIGKVDGNDKRLDDDWNLLPKEVLRYAKNHFKFNFKEVNKYIYINNRYELSSSTTYIKKKDWDIID